MASDNHVTGLGRLGVAQTGATATKTHQVVLIDEFTGDTVASAFVDLQLNRGGDLNGYVWAGLPRGVTVLKGAYFSKS
jgi:hypothetical protein